jgi:glycosyltransferase involved in cell wall biosynthesis
LKKKKILMLNYEYPPIGGGAANANYHLLEEFKKHPELEIDLITSGLNGLEVERISENIRVFKLGIRKKDLHFWRASEIASWTWKACRFSRRLINEKDYDLCHCWSGWPSGMVGYWFKKKVPYIVALRGSDVPGYNRRLRLLDKFVFGFLSRVIWKNARAVTASSIGLKNLAQRTSDEVNIQVIYNGIDPTRFRPVAEKRQSGIDTIFVGRLIERKGVNYLLKAFKEVSDEYEDCRLIIVGDGPERRKLENFCKESQIESKVRFLGAVRREDIPEIYQNASIFVLPSLQESLSNALQEALASGLPVITTDTGAAELMDNNGFVVEKGNHAQIKKAIIEYIKDPQLLRLHGIRSRELADRMRWDNAAKAYIEIYNRAP